MNTKFVTWWRAFRYHFVPPSFLPAILGSTIAWSLTGNFYPHFFIITILGVTINHIALNMTDDYYDYINSVDRAKNREQNPYSGGSGTLTGGHIKPSQMHQAFLIFYIITILLGLYLVYARGLIILFFGIFGIASAYFYTAPPIHYGYHGFGEISQLINFSFTIGMGAYYVQVQQFSFEAFVILLPLGFMMFSMITINEIPDEQNDREGNKRTLVVIWGVKKAIWFYSLGMIFSYLIIIISPLLNITTYWTYLSLATIPWFIQAFIILLQNYKKFEKLSSANLLTIKIHNITGILLIIAYLIKGILQFNSLYAMWTIIAVLVILYTPVALTIFNNIVPVKMKEVTI